MDRTQETLNYMTECFTDSDFVCFIPVASSYGQKYIPNDRNTTLMAVHTLESETRCISDSGVREKTLIQEGKLFLAVILGVDNGSHMKRFTDQQAFGSWLSDVGVYEPDSDPEALFYNS